MKKENLKQKILLGLSAFFTIIGVINFKVFGDKAIEVSTYVSSDNENEIQYNIGDVQLVSANVVAENLEESAEITNQIENSEDYFAKTKLERNLMYSEMLETYEKILENEKISEEQKEVASTEITNITNIKNGIMISENLLKNKGFENVVVLMNSGKASVVVGKSTLNQEDIAKIQNIVCNNLKLDIKNITISIYTEK